MKTAGILHHISSLPSNYGIGDFGENAYKFVDLIVENNLKTWQILPLSPVGYGNSPYQPYSSFAGEDIYIDLDNLIEMGLLEETEQFNTNSTKVDFQNVRNFKEAYYKIAFENFKNNYSKYEDMYEKFIKENSWVNMFAIFITFKELHNLKKWSEWDEEYKFYPENKQVDLTKFENEINYIKFKQWLFFKQWFSLKDYANQKQIEIIGDVPIYVGEDSQDFWENKNMFLTDQEGNLTHVAGCPPDELSSEGQVWGNPLYNWEKLKETNFEFLINRFSTCAKLYDSTRIDHFLGFDRYGKIPFGDKTAVDATWEDAYGDEFFEQLFKAYPNLNLIAEDLGSLREKTYELRDKYNLPGMKIYLWNVNDDHIYFPKGENMIAYTGSHDNDTIKDKIEHFNKKQLKTFKREFKQFDKHISLVWNYIYMVLLDEANRVIIPTCDIMELGNEAKFNTPSTLGDHNWTWKLADFNDFNNSLKTYKLFIEKSNRN